MDKMHTQKCQIHWNEKVTQFHFTTISHKQNNKIWSFRKLILYTKFIVPMDQMDVYKYFIYLYHFDIYGWALYTIPEKNDSEFMGQQSHGGLDFFVFFFCFQWYNTFIVWEIISFIIDTIIAPGIQRFIFSFVPITFEILHNIHHQFII